MINYLGLISTFIGCLLLRLAGSKLAGKLSANEVFRKITFAKYKEKKFTYPLMWVLGFLINMAASRLLNRSGLSTSAIILYVLLQSCQFFLFVVYWLALNRIFKPKDAQ